MIDNTVPIKVLDHGCVELVDRMGSDLAIVQAAQSSFNNPSLFFGDREKKILASLMRERHGVPFEHVSLKFKVKMPIDVARQLVKHRISSWSEKSARYSVMDMEFHVPELADVRSNVGKPMLYKFDKADTEAAAEFIDRLVAFHDLAKNSYEWALEHGIAREQARYFLPITTFTTVTWTMNGRGLLNMLSLRNDVHAQAETREYAKAIEDLAETVIPETIRLFNQYGRKVP